MLLFPKSLALLCWMRSGSKPRFWMATIGAAWLQVMISGFDSSEKEPKVSLRSIGTVRILSSDRHPVRIVTARRNAIFEFGFT
jgi:hypothetical protein